jgi:hypothetical protein
MLTFQTRTGYALAGLGAPYFSVSLAVTAQ